MNAFDQAFRDFLARRELRIPTDAATGRVMGFAGPKDRAIAWVRASGEAELYSFVTYHRSYHPDFPVPYHVAQVALAEGPLLTSRVRGVAAADLAIGMKLKAAFDEDGTLVFDPA